jgi:CheY-like chemotaxis protein
VQKKVLIVDDDSSFLEEIGEVLKKNNLSTRTVRDSSLALSEARSYKPDVIILDLKMDYVNGFQIAKRLKHFPETGKIPVIAISGYFNRKEHSALMDMCGLVRFLEKPIKPPVLLTQINTVLYQN